MPLIDNTSPLTVVNGGDQAIAQAINQLAEIIRSHSKEVVAKSKDHDMDQKNTFEVEKTTKATAETQQTETAVSKATKDNINETMSFKDQISSAAGAGLGMVQGAVVSEGQKAISQIWDSTGFSNVISRQATEMFEGSVKGLAEKDVRQFAKAGVMPSVEEIETMMNVARGENKVYKETMNYMDIKSWEKQLGVDFTNLSLSSMAERLGFK
jgi:hypothetical protein